MTITLIVRPLTKKGKQICKAHGNAWRVLLSRDNVEFSPVKKHWHLCAPVSDLDNRDLDRWINEKGDPNFVVDHRIETK